MTRPLFDPERLRGPDKDSAKPANRAMTVTRLSELVESALRDGTPSAVRVIGEVSSINDRTHWYFTLKDESSVVSCVLFRRGKGMRSDKPQIGDEVVVTGRVSYYAPQGRLQLYADAIEPVGAGELDRRFKALCAELRAEGYFDHERKRAIPSFPRRVAVITSRTGAALQDVLDTMRRRCPAVDVLVVDVRVQGDGAARQIGATLNRISKDHASLGVDAVLVTRGGGSMEDLWGFNERPVADAILNCKIPVVAAIGHETDTTVAELVADLRCATPTQAAMRLTPDRDALFQQVNALKARLRDLFGRSLSDQFLFLERSWKRQRLVVSNRMTSAHLRLERLGARLAAHRPA
ncbi:MAG: exodeoxyribonuclease VII large subunit, partial [Planctomycetota bacterium]